MAGDPARELGYQKRRAEARQELVKQITIAIHDIKKNRIKESIKRLIKLSKEWNY